MDKGSWAGEITENQPVRGVFVVKSMTAAKTRAGKAFLSLVLMDRTGEIGCPVWDLAEERALFCAEGKIVSVEAVAQKYKEALQLKLDRIEPVADAVADPGWFMPVSPHAPETMRAELAAIVDGLPDPAIRALLRSFLQDQDFVAAFMAAPAAKLMHHAYLGGLLEHSLSMVRLAGLVADYYPTLDRSLLAAGAMLHDIGKVREFAYEKAPFQYTDEGRLVGHMVIAIELIGAKIRQCGNFPPDLAVRLKHLILSHHGCHEFGSPTVPMTREAFVLNFIDDLDAKMNYIDRLGAGGDGGYRWTDYQKTLERFLYVRPAGASAGDEAAGPPATVTPPAATRPESLPGPAPIRQADCGQGCTESRSIPGRQPCLFDP